LLAAFVQLDRRSASPLLPPALLRRPGIAGANLVAAVNGATTNTSIFFFALFAQQALGLSPLAAGIGFLPCNGAVVVGSALAGWLAGRHGYRLPTIVGMGVVAGGLLLLARLSPAAEYATTLLPGLVVMGFGLGLAQIGLVGAGTAAAPTSERGVAAGLLTTSAQIGTAVGLAVLVAVAAAAEAPLAGATSATLAAGFRVAFLVAALLAVGGTLLAATTFPRDPTARPRRR